MKSLNTIRCPICYLIPKIFKSQYNEYSEPSFIFTILCPNNHIKRIYNDKLITEIKFSLIDIPCTKCNLKNKSIYYCKECYAILCEMCKESHILNFNHKDIRTINEIDNICLMHNKNFYLYCKTCEIEICKECIKSKKHKDHEINELKTININKLKTNIKKYKNNFKKNVEKNKKTDIKNYKNNQSKYLSISKIEQKYKTLNNNIYTYINFIKDLINNYELYIKYYNIPSYTLYLNLNLVYKNINSPKIIYSKNYEKDLIRIEDYKYYYYYHYKNKCEDGRKLYCGLYKDENQDLTYVYYNLDNKKLYFFNLETWNYKKEIKLEIKEEISVKTGFWAFAYAQLKFFKFKDIELFLIYLEDIKTISIYDITDNNNYKKIFFRDIDSNYGKVFIDYINNKILIIFLNEFEIYFFNIYNQLEMKLNTKGINLESILFFRMKILGKMLFISNKYEGIIYNLKSLKIYKKIEIEDIKKVIIGDLYDKKCLIISCDDQGYIIYIIDFFNHQKMYKYNLRTTGYGYGIVSMFLMNYKIFIIRVSDDFGNWFAIYSINLITDEEEKNDKTFNKFNNSAYELKKVKLKNFGECILELPEDLTWKNNIGLFYFNKNVNKDTNEHIKKIKNFEKKTIDFKNYKERIEVLVKISENKIKRLKNKKEGSLNSEELLEKFRINFNINIDNKIKESESLEDELYKIKKNEYKIYENKLEELKQYITNCENDLEMIKQIIEEEEKSLNTSGEDELDDLFDLFD